MKYIKTKEDFVNEKKSYQLNEGQFSWMTHDSEEQIGSERPNTIDVWMYDNKGNSWAEKRYEGYGEFGGKDYYDLLAEMNGYTQADADKMKKELRSIGIDLAFGKLKTKDKKRKVLFPALVTSPKYNWKRHDFTQEAESDPNQSWYQEEDYGDPYESANETNSGNFYDFKYDIALAVDNLGISPKAIKRVSKKGKGYEVRMSSYMSNEDTWKKLGDSFGATLTSFTPGNINIGIYENSAKDVLQDATNALTKTFGSKKLDKKYIKDYLKSIEQIARKNPGQLVKDYGEFDVSDWIEDVRYNMANESLSDEALYESTFGIKTDGNAATKGIQELQKDLTKAKIKYKFNRLSMTLSVIDVDKKEFKKAEEIINKHMKGAMSLMMAKESTLSINEAWNFTEKQVKDVADLIAKAIEKLDNMNTKVHDMEYDKGRGAGFEIAMGGDQYEGGSYTVKPNGDVVNSAIGNKFPNAVYAKIGDRDIKKVMKNIQKFESEITEASGDKAVSMAQKKVDKVMADLKANLLKFKNAKTDSDKETFKTEAGKLTKLRKEAQDNLEKAIGDAYTDVELVVMENYDTEQRKEMAAKGLALPDGSFPIKTVEDLKNAIQAYGRAKDQSAAAKFIAKRAKALGAEDLIPDTEDFQKALKEASFGRIPKFGK